MVTPQLRSTDEPVGRPRDHVYLAINNTDVSGTALVIEFPNEHAVQAWLNRVEEITGDDPEPFGFRAEAGVAVRVLSPDDALALIPDWKRTHADITQATLAVFLAYARDASNWSGTPLVGGNVGGSKEERGNLTQLKQAALITTWEEREPGHPRCTWIDFTEKGQELATEHGVYLGVGERRETAGQRELLAKLRREHGR